MMLRTPAAFCFICLIAITYPQSLPASQITPTADENGFIAHKALYDIKLESVRSGSQVVNISGQMLYEWAPDCEGWNSTHRFNLDYDYADAPPIRITSDFSAIESFDGKTLNFLSQRKEDGELFEEVRGNATLDETNSGEATYTKPKDVVYNLPTGTLFPMSHSIRIAKDMKAGKTFTNATIFDGSDSNGPVEVNGFIGKAVDLKPYVMPFNEIPAIEASMLNSPAKEVRMAFFPLNDASNTPDYEMTLIVHENSVISDMSVEYGEFTIHQNLIALEPLGNACENNQTKRDQEVEEETQKETE